MITPFWANNITILFDKSSIFQLWPASCMNFEEKLNAITRLIILLTLFGYLLTFSIRFLIIGVLTILAIFIIYYLRKQKMIKDLLMKNTENFTNQNDDLLNSDMNTDLINNTYLPSEKSKNGNSPILLNSIIKKDYHGITKENPLGNVLLPEINEQPNRKAAPPSFNPDVYEDIDKATKKAIQSMNPGIKNTDRQLFGDLGNNFEFDQSMWYFYSNASTKVPNDQGAFADYLYGTMPSCRGGDSNECFKDNYRYILR
jgi:hypothetical protein